MLRRRMRLPKWRDDLPVIVSGIVLSACQSTSKSAFQSAEVDVVETSENEVKESQQLGPRFRIHVASEV